MSEREDHTQLADELEERADRLQTENDKLGDKIGDVRDDWERKRADPGVPGAAPDIEASVDDEPGDDDEDDDKGDGDADGEGLFDDPEAEEEDEDE
jgi:hypothetical protein